MCMFEIFSSLSPNHFLNRRCSQYNLFDQTPQSPLAWEIGKRYKHIAISSINSFLNPLFLSHQVLHTFWLMVWNFPNFHVCFFEFVVEEGEIVCLKFLYRLEKFFYNPSIYVLKTCHFGKPPQSPISPKSVHLQFSTWVHQQNKSRIIMAWLFCIFKLGINEPQKNNVCRTHLTQVP